MIRYHLPDKSPMSRCRECGADVVLTKKNGYLVLIDYRTVTTNEREKLVGYEHTCSALTASK